MALSEQEQRMLDEIERALVSEDPRLARQVRQGGGGFSLSGRALALIILGLVMLVGGIVLAQFSLWFVALSVVGFFVMFGGALLTLRGGAPKKAQVPGKQRARGAMSQPQRQGGLGDRMEDNFRRRFER